MGGGSKRKEEDSPIIRRPRKVVSSGAGGGSGSEGGVSVGDICIPSFETALSNDIVELQDNEGVSLRKNTTGIYEVIVRAKKVGELNKRISKMVTTCLDTGVTYSGTVIEKKQNEFLARFIRK